ncbi:hypothetical protein RFI_38819 [Reticulomyxa filosa]|uniref:Uncharacterized protein n=1 Tax=Reticulomyxa filosa TaxID=46433 RepID=X6LD34_RETFI|nr:hypothetical protein RFI_38819 [Reticulomyxa filosa]|eukprot:ETN98674.1 hypothetical protein RFI_38819 [Reticulomyxa filosa]
MCCPNKHFAELYYFKEKKVHIIVLIKKLRRKHFLQSTERKLILIFANEQINCFLFAHEINQSGEGLICFDLTDSMYANHCNNDNNNMIIHVEQSSLNNICTRTCTYTLNKKTHQTERTIRYIYETIVPKQNDKFDLTMKLMTHEMASKMDALQTKIDELASQKEATAKENQDNFQSFEKVGRNKGRYPNVNSIQFQSFFGFFYN